MFIVKFADSAPPLTASSRRQFIAGIFFGIAMGISIGMLIAKNFA